MNLIFKQIEMSAACVALANKTLENNLRVAEVLMSSALQQHAALFGYKTPFQPANGSGQTATSAPAFKSAARVKAPAKAKAAPAPEAAPKPAAKPAAKAKPAPKAVEKPAVESVATPVAK